MARSTRSVPAQLRYAVVLLATAGAGDVVTHAVTAPAGLQAVAHVATLVGMTATLAAVVTTGLHRSRPHHNRR